MISKDQYCKIMMQKFEKSEGREAREEDILSSSVLAVAMEHLGLLKSDQYRQYAAERGGVLYTYWDFDKKGITMLSMREMLELLPDEVELRTA